ncbi:MAG: FecR domain-containing protein, partial [Acidobacteria bacterium]|nr:FecR domain-containing protein [Acidobacteriota bacterium]
MKQRLVTSAITAVLAVTGTWMVGLPAARAQSADEDAFAYAYDPVAEDVPAAEAAEVESGPFARVRHADDAVRVVREDGFAEDIDQNAPIYPGDRVDSRDGQRAELQFPDGTLVRVDGGTTLDVVALAEPGRRGIDTVIGLRHGSISADVPGQQAGDFRIDTPSCSVYVVESSVLRVDTTSGDEVRVSLQRGRVEVAGERDSVVLEGTQRTLVLPGGSPRRPWNYNAYARDSFDAWVAQRAGVYQARPGREYNDLPDEVRPYYDELSYYGDWVYDDDYGWVWDPETDDNWRPYYSGYWSPGPYGPVWVGYEPWGWSVYRYGRWGFSAHIGWFWVPGFVFRPAHVYWYYGPSYVGWCPLGYWDTPVFYGSYYWGHPWFDGHPWAFIPYNNFYYTHVNKIPRHRVLPDHLGRGVISRRAMVPVRDGHGGRGGRGVEVRKLAPDTYEKVRRVAERRPALARPVKDVDVRAEKNRPTRSFRDVEKVVRERKDGSRAVRSREPGREQAVPPRRTNPGSAEAGRDKGTVRPRTERGEATAPRGGTPTTQPKPKGDTPVIRVRPGSEKGSGDRKTEPGGVAPRTFERRSGRAQAVAPGSGAVGQGRAPADGESVRRFFGRLANEGADKEKGAPQRAAPSRFPKRGEEARADRPASRAVPAPRAERGTADRGASRPSAAPVPRRDSSRPSATPAPRRDNSRPSVAPAPRGESSRPSAGSAPRGSASRG